jgi:cobalt-zinc-cadmium resistance protein CzcA
VEESNLKALELSLNSDYMKTLQEYSKSLSSLTYYREEGLGLATALYQVAEKSYRAGEAGYLEYIRNLEEAFRIQSDYLQT